MSETKTKVVKLDGRRVKSREKLRVAIAILLKAKSIEKISIEEIANQAGVTRPTFYSNYKDLQAIVIEYVHELMTGLVKDFEQFDTDLSMNPQERLEVSMIHYIKVLKQHHGILLSVASGRGGNEALDVLRTYNMKILLVRAKRVPNSGLSPLDLLISMHFYSGAINTLLEAHASGKIIASSEQLAHSIATFLHRGLGQELGNPD